MAQGVRIPSVSRVTFGTPTRLPPRQTQQVAPISTVPDTSGVGKAIIGMEISQGKVAGLDFSNRYTMAWKESEAAIKGIQGDPTRAWFAHDKNMDDMMGSFEKEWSGYNPVVQRQIRSTLSRSHNTLYQHSIMTRADQTNKYVNNTIEASKALLKQQMGESLGIGLEAMDNLISDMIDISQLQARMNGTSRFEELPEGHIGPRRLIETPISIRQRVGDLSDGINDSISLAINTGHLDIAERAMERYSMYLTTKQTSKLSKDLSDEKVDLKALENVEKLQGLGKDKALDFLEKIKDPKVKSETVKQLSLRKNRLTSIRKDVSRDIFNSYYDLITNNKELFRNTEDLEQFGGFKQAKTKMTAEDQKALYSIIGQINDESEERKISDQAALDFIDGKIQDGSFGEMTLRDLAPYTSRLTKVFRSSITSMLKRQQRIDKGEARERELTPKQILGLTYASYKTHFETIDRNTRKKGLTKAKHTEGEYFKYLLFDIIADSGVTEKKELGLFINNMVTKWREDRKALPRAFKRDFNKVIDAMKKSLGIFRAGELKKESAKLFRGAISDFQIEQSKHEPDYMINERRLKTINKLNENLVLLEEVKKAYAVYIGKPNEPVEITDVFLNWFIDNEDKFNQGEAE